MFFPETGRRAVVVPPPAQDALRDVPPHGSGLVFTSPADRMWAQPAPPRLLVAAKALHETAPPRLLRRCATATTLLLERGATPWDVAIQLCHTDGGQLVMSLYGHPSEAGGPLASARGMGGRGPPTACGYRRDESKTSAGIRPGSIHPAICSPFHPVSPIEVL